MTEFAVFGLGLHTVSVAYTELKKIGLTCSDSGGNPKAQVHLFSSLSSFVRKKDKLEKKTAIVISDTPTLLDNCVGIVPLDYQKSNGRSWQFTFIQPNWQAIRNAVGKSGTFEYVDPSIILPNVIDGHRTGHFASAYYNCIEVLDTRKINTLNLGIVKCLNRKSSTLSSPVEDAFYVRRHRVLAEIIASNLPVLHRLNTAFEEKKPVEKILDGSQFTKEDVKCLKSVLKASKTLAQKK